MSDAHLGRSVDVAAVQAALGVLYPRFGILARPAVEVVPSPRLLVPVDSATTTVPSTPPIWNPSELERRMSAAIAEGLQALALVGGFDPQPRHANNDSATAIGIGARARFLGWDMVRGATRLLSMSQMIVAEIGWWRDELFATEELNVKVGKHDPDARRNETAARAREALEGLKRECSFGIFGVSRALVVPWPAVWKQAGLPHRDGGPAILFPDGWALHCLNGVSVPDWLALTPAEQIEPARLLMLQNAEHRREFVRKVGVERICARLNAKVLDRKTIHFPARRVPAGVGPDGPTDERMLPAYESTYELVNLDLGDGRRRPYLKMLNPSVPGLYHLEGVPPDVVTVQEAINWRVHRDKWKHWKPEVLT